MFGTNPQGIGLLQALAQSEGSGLMANASYPQPYQQQGFSGSFATPSFNPQAQQPKPEQPSGLLPSLGFEAESTAQPSALMSMFDPEAVKSQQVTDTLLGVGAALMEAGAPSTDPGAASRGWGNVSRAISGANQTAQNRMLQGHQLQQQAQDKAYNRAVDERAWNTARQDRAQEIDYRNTRDGVMDARHADQTTYNRGRDNILDARYSEQTDYARGRDAAGDAFRDKQFAYTQAQDERLAGLKVAEIEAKNKGKNPFGNSYEANLINVLLNGDPRSPEYKAAYNAMGQPKVQYDPATGRTITTNPDMSAFRMPAGAQSQNAALQAGEMGGKGGVDIDRIGSPKFSQGELASAGFANRMTKADEIISGLEGGGYDPSSMGAHLPNLLPDGVSAYARSPDSQQYRQAQEDWVRAKLRLESGAVIGEEEMSREISTYFPQPGDTPEVIAQKARARQTATQNLQAQSQGAYAANFGATNARQGGSLTREQMKQMSTEDLWANLPSR